MRHMWNLYIVSHHPHLPGTWSLNFLEDKFTVDRSLRLIQYQYFKNGNVGSAFKIRTEPDCFFPPAATLSGHPVPTLYLHFLFHRQPEQTLETASRAMSLPRRCPSSDSQSHQLPKMQKNLSVVYSILLIGSASLLYISLSRYFSDFPAALTLTGFPDGPCMCQASSHIRAFIVALLCLGPALRDGCMADCWCLSSLCTRVTTSVKPHPNRDC